MADDSLRSTVTFSKAFHIDGVEGDYPPGTYSIEVSRKAVEGLSFIADKRTKATIKLPAPNAAYVSRQIVEIEPDELEAALARDKETSHAPTATPVPKFAIGQMVDFVPLQRGHAVLQNCAGASDRRPRVDLQH